MAGGVAPHPGTPNNTFTVVYRLPGAVHSQAQPGFAPFLLNLKITYVYMNVLTYSAVLYLFCVYFLQFLYFDSYCGRSNYFNKRRILFSAGLR